MRSRQLAVSLLTLVVLLAACGDDNPNGAPSSTGPPAGPTTSTSTPVGPTTTVDTDSTTTSLGSASTSDPCGLFNKAELEEAVGFTLSAGMFTDLTAQGIDGSTCFFQADNANTANVSVTIVAGSQAVVLFKYDLPEGGEDLDGIGDRAYLALGDFQSNLHVLKGDALVAVDIVHGSPVRPEDIDERLADLAGIAAGRL